MIPRSAGALLCALSITAGCASTSIPARTISVGAVSRSEPRQAIAAAPRTTPPAQVVHASVSDAPDATVHVSPAVALSTADEGISLASAEEANPAHNASDSAVTMAALVAQENARRAGAASAQLADVQTPRTASSGLQSGTAGSSAAESSGPDTPTTETGETVTAVTAPAASAALPVPNGSVVLNLDNVLQMAEAQNPQIAVARERINEAYARALRAGTAWLPSLRSGINYNHHEGTIQDVAGRVFPTNRSALYGGLGANGVGAASPTIPGMLAQFHFADALFQPVIAGHQTAARQFGATAVRNDTLRDAAIAYLELVRAEHASRISQEAADNTRKLSELTRQFAEVGEGLKSDYTRMQAELSIRRANQLVEQEAVQVASARLAQLLHANAGVLITSGEPAIAPLDILSAEAETSSYVADGLQRRPELAEQKHLVCEAVERLRKEQFAPLVPSVLLGVSYGAMGGGLGSTITNTGDRWDADAIAYWELRNLGFGEQAARRETASQARQARLRKVAILDQVAREVVEAHARVNGRRARVAVAEEGIAAAENSYRLNWERIENAQGLPIEVLQSVQALSTARRTYLDAVIDYNIAQFQLCHATGVLVQ